MYMYIYKYNIYRIHNTTFASYTESFVESRKRGRSPRSQRPKLNIYVLYALCLILHQRSRRVCRKAVR